MWKCRNRACNTGNYAEDSHCALCGEARRPQWMVKGTICIKSIEGNGVVGYGHLKEAKELAIASVKRAAERPAFGTRIREAKATIQEWRRSRDE